MVVSVAELYDYKLVAVDYEYICINLLRLCNPTAISRHHNRFHVLNQSNPVPLLLAQVYQRVSQRQAQPPHGPPGVFLAGHTGSCCHELEGVISDPPHNSVLVMFRLHLSGV